MKTIARILRPSWRFSDELDESGTDSGKQTQKIIISIVLIVVACIVFVWYFSHGSRPSAIAVAPYAALGQVTAEETAKLLESKGRILLVAPDPVEYATTPGLQDEVKSFDETVKKQGVTVVATENVQFNADSSSAQGLGGDVYVEFLKKYTDIDAVVSLVGPPVFTPETAGQLPQKLPKFIAVSLRGAPLKKLIQADIVQLAIIPRLQPASVSATLPRSAREVFDKLYQIVTPDDAKTLPND